jgi:AcrR family transcriptional regulator
VFLLPQSDFTITWTPRRLDTQRKLIYDFNSFSHFVKVIYMGIDEKEREQAILEAAAQLLLRHGYNKTTMSDVADAVDLNRALIYLHFKSKDEVVEALIVRELEKYGALWSHALEADPLGGSVASIYRSMVPTLKHLPLMAAILTRDEQTFGKYLRKPGNLFTSLATPITTRDALQAMQELGVVRQDVNIVAVAFIMDALTPSILETLSSHREELGGDSERLGRPSYEELMETMTEMFERMLTPESGANLEAGKAALLQGRESTQARFI